MQRHIIRWYGIGHSGPPDYRRFETPRTRAMSGKYWGWDARCSCGWQTRTGGAIQERIREAIADHKWFVAIARELREGVAPAIRLEEEYDAHEHR